MYWKYAELKEKKGVTDKEVSMATGISQTVLSNWKTRSGQKYLSFENMAKLARYFNEPIESFAEVENQSLQQA